MRALWNRIPSWVRLTLLLFVATRVVLVGFGIAVRESAPPQVANSPYALHPTGNVTWDIWAVFDSRWYLDIARVGYATVPDRDPTPVYPYAFPPFYPLAMRGLGVLVGGPYPAALILSNLALIGSALLLHRFAERRWGPNVARWSVILLFLSPMGFLLSATYAESLFLFLALAALTAADRSRWWFAGLLVGLASVTRLVGLVLFVPLLLQWFAQRPRRFPDLIGIAIGVVPLLLFLLYAQHQLGDFLAPLHAHGSPPWDRHLANPLVTVYRGLTSPSMEPVAWSLTAILECVAFAFAVRRIGLRLALTGFLLMLVPLSTGLMSTIRLTAVQFPLLLLFAWVCERYPSSRAVVFLVAGLLQLALFAQWTTAHQLLV